MLFAPWAMRINFKLQTSNLDTFLIKTLGCKVNQYESQVIRESFLSRGYREDVTSPRHVVINTCAVTARAEAKGRKLIRRFLRLFPSAEIYLTGCGLTYSERLHRSLWRLIPPDRRGSLKRMKYPGPPITSFDSHSRAFVRVQTGCDAFCSYCIIPHLRGSPRSRPPGEVVQEVSDLAVGGYPEIVLTGINLGEYGRDLSPSLKLTDLLPPLQELKGEFRIRLSSIEPREVTEELIGLFSREGRLCPHLHIPLQSGSTRILKWMNRPYSSAEYRRLILSLKERLPDLAVSTDIMVGYPGEERDDFLASCRAVEENGFIRVHIFPYSRREGTAAASLPGLSPEVVRRRVRELEEFGARASARFREKMVGRVVKMVVDSRLGGRGVAGYEEHYLRVEVPGANLPLRSLCRVEITGISAAGCRGRQVRAYSKSS